MACAVVVLRWIPPSEMGVWQTLLLIESYCQLVRLGIVNAMNREYPFLLGRGNAAEAIRYVQTAEFYTLSMVLLQVIGLTAAALLLAPSDINWRLGMLTLAVYAPSNLYRGFLEATYRGGQEFARLARAQWVLMVLSIVSLGLVIAFDFIGFCIRNLLLAIVSASVYFCFRPVEFKPRLSIKILKYLFWAGLPLFVSNYLTVVASTFNRVILLQQNGTMAVGLFAPVAAVITLGTLLPSTLSVYLLPRITYDFGASGSATQTIRQALKVALATSLLMAPLLVIGWCLLPVVVRKFAPLYSEATTAMRIGLLVTVFGGVKLSTTAFSVLQAWKPMFVYLFILVGTSWIGPWAAVRSWPGSPLEGVAIGMLAASIVQIPVVLGCLYWAATRAPRKHSRI